MYDELACCLLANKQQGAELCLSIPPDHDALGSAFEKQIEGLSCGSTLSRAIYETLDLGLDLGRLSAMGVSGPHSAWRWDQQYEDCRVVATTLAIGSLRIYYLTDGSEGWKVTELSHRLKAQPKLAGTAPNLVGRICVYKHDS